MSFCRECGKEVQEDWNTCPFCSASMTSHESAEKVLTDLSAAITKTTNIAQQQQNTTIELSKGNKVDSGDIVVGIIFLIIAAISYAEYSASACGTILSLLVDQCSEWNSFNLVCGGAGILAILLGLRGKPAK